MQRNEIKLWIEYHSVLFPEWEVWRLGKATPERNIQFQVWYKAFSKTSLEDAKQATDAMAAGEIQRPYSVADHVAAVIKKSTQIEQARRHASRPRSVDGQQTYRCPHCQDFGAVVIRHPKYEPRGLCLDCCCQADRGQLRYDPERMQRVDPLPLPDDQVPYHAKTRQYAANIGRISE